VLVTSWQLAEELAAVMRRPRIARYDVSERDVEDVLHLLAPGLPTADVEVEIRDPKDAPVISAALAGDADAIITGDKDLLDDGALRAWLAHHGVEVLTPRELLRELSA
jgi:putative PIN family toxin of toxin-antitoxin system